MWIFLTLEGYEKWYPRYVFYALFANYITGGTRRFENKTTGLVNNEPFSNFDLNELFGVAIPTIVDIINVLHGSIMVA
jgi:hypothetical protein